MKIPEIHPQGLNQSCTLKEVCGDKMTQVTLNFAILAAYAVI